MLSKAFIVLAILGTCSGNLIGDQFNKTIVNITSQLGNMYFDEFSANSGKQEFGEFNLTLLDVYVTGLDELLAEVIEISLLPTRVKNVTLHIPKLSVLANNYHLTGSILFPFGDKILPLTGGDDYLRFALHDLYLSFYINFSTSNGQLSVSELTMLSWAFDMDFHAEKFMGGDQLGWAFNTVLDDCAIVAYEYYKDAVIAAIHDDLVEFINSNICKSLPNLCD